MTVGIRQLKQFVVLAEELHYGRAAERLHMSQPPLSQAILQLEKEIGALLFTRNKRMVELTQVGKEWLPHAYRLLDQWSALVGLPQRISNGLAGTLNLAFLSMTTGDLLPRVLSPYTEKFPNVIFNLQEMSNPSQIDAIANKKIDAGLLILPQPGSYASIIDHIAIRTEPMMMAIPKSWIDKGRATVDGYNVAFPGFHSIPIFRFPRHAAPMLSEGIDRFCSAKNFHPTVVQGVSHAQALASLVSTGIGMTLVPESIASFRPAGVRYVRITEDAPQLTISLAWRKDEVSALLRGLIEMTQCVADQISSAAPLQTGAQLESAMAE